MTAPARVQQRLPWLCVIVAAAVFFAVRPGTSIAEDKSRIVIHAVVLAVDPARSLVALHHEALETGAATDRICRLKHRRDALFLTRGTVIEATAETAHQPWVLEDVHVRARTLVTNGPQGTI
jgi:hypothetical protein